MRLPTIMEILPRQCWFNKDIKFGHTALIVISMVTLLLNVGLSSIANQITGSKCGSKIF